MGMQYRVQKIISMAGICSRRKAEEMIIAGRVIVNGKAIPIGTTADPEKDTLVVDGKKLILPSKKYYAFHKPKGFLSAMVAHEGKHPISLFFPSRESLFPIGRLDYNAEGLMLVTNDGDFANRVMHPRYEVEKEYRVVLDKPYTKDAERRISSGIIIEGRKVDAVIQQKENKIVHITLHEGRKHIVKKIFAQFGFRVFRLIRIRIGNVLLENLLPGKYRSLTKQEVLSFGSGNHR